MVYGLQTERLISSFTLNYLKKVFFYSLIVALYLLTPVCGMAILGNAVSKKYEVDEAYWRIDADKKLTSEQRKYKTDLLDDKGKMLENRIILLAITGLTSFITATTLLAKRRTLTIAKKSGT